MNALNECPEFFTCWECGEVRSETPCEICDDGHEWSPDCEIFAADEKACRRGNYPREPAGCSHGNPEECCGGGAGEACSCVACHGPCDFCNRIVPVETAGGDAHDQLICADCRC